MAASAFAGGSAPPDRRVFLGISDAADALFDRAFGAAGNPLRQLGALGFLLFWIVIASGAYLYVFFDTSVHGAFTSVDRLTKEQWFAGGVMRSVHRYASDAFAVIVMLHLLREWVKGRYTGFRWFSWITGVPLLWLMFAAGLGGYWLVWDRLAQFTAIASAEWLDWLPLFGDALTRNFVAPEAVNDRFFSLLVFMHIGIPLFLLLFLFVHIHRISRPVTWPAKPAALGMAAVLLVLAVVQPVASQGAADLAKVPLRLALDWFYLGPLVFAYGVSAGTLWSVLFAATALLAALPWLAPRPGKNAILAPAEMDLANCNGCGRCVDDCPYAAVIMVPRHDGRSGTRQAQVLPDLCAACGICAGSCPSATPFRSEARLASGIDLPQLPVDALRRSLAAGLAAWPRPGGSGLVIFGCDQGVPASSIADADTIVLSLPCLAMLPPSFIDFALRRGAAGVVLAGCREGDCAFRFGDALVLERIAGRREPHLRRTLNRSHVATLWAGRPDFHRLTGNIEAFRASLRAIPGARVSNTMPESSSHESDP
jgi:ferredoxin/coenzyme F420-reducing hydrogenase delta subunit